MSYYFNKTIKSNFEDVILKVTDALKKEGFGVLTDIPLGWMDRLQKLKKC